MLEEAAPQGCLFAFGEMPCQQAPVSGAEPGARA
jgi:hypothetical protein